MSGVLPRIEQFLEDEVEPQDRKELATLLVRARGGDDSAIRDLESRFSGPLPFGTAGIRGILGAGESRMNRSLVLRGTPGLALHVIASIPPAEERGGGEMAARPPTSPRRPPPRSPPLTGSPSTGSRARTRLPFSRSPSAISA